MNDALMIGVILTLLFGAVIFYLYNRLSMTERKMGLFEGVLTDLKIMMDSAPFASGPPPVYEFEPTPEYLNAISGPVPIQKDEIDEVGEDDDYQQTLEQALQSASASDALDGSSSDAFRMLHIDETQQNQPTGQPSINVTKLSPDLESLTVKELNALAKQKNLTVPSGTRRKELIDLLKKADGPNQTQGTFLSSMLDGPSSSEGAPLDSTMLETTL
jgi:hypothetical protein